jgi:NAD+ synthase
VATRRAEPSPDLIRIPPSLAIDCRTTTDLLVDFVRRETSKAGFRRVVLGLSGGVDSAVSAAVARRALGARGLLCVLLPYRTSDPRSLRDARRVAGFLKAKTTAIDISPMIDAYFKSRPGASRVRRGNKMARERMAILYDLSARHRALVLGTSNKTELLLGYGTIHGDMASAINPLGDLYKTQVRLMGLHLGLPSEIVWKTATADLWAGQSDEGEIGYRYVDIDRLLELLVERRAGPEEAVAAGFSIRMVRHITHLMMRSQFKRRPPLIAKLSSRTINLDFRYPRDWGR